MRTRNLARAPVQVGLVTARQARQQLEMLLVTTDLMVAAALENRIVSRLHIDRMTTAAWERRIAAYAELDRLRTISGKPDAPRDNIGNRA